ncbi:hypothetical protein MRB53_010370 [Persea americana]|uniref:Uncharacterized protein n=1 Tax=Persea americana TaxID=3435 RepID=A0ACC2LSE0_PERAE|nr:hypothetical protein MRB53_010370 [Persea americana]
MFFCLYKQYMPDQSRIERAQLPCGFICKTCFYERATCGFIYPTQRNDVLKSGGQVWSIDKKREESEGELARVTQG